MESTVAKAIREARRATGLTQKQLAARLGLNERAVYRWEGGASAPKRRYRAPLVTVIQQVNPAAGAALAAALASASRREVVAAPQVAPASVAPSVDPAQLVELALFEFAEELNVPARPARVALAKLQRRLRESSAAGAEVGRIIESWAG
jgi:transcriptional regulator with XRE-family HTH domain